MVNWTALLGTELSMFKGREAKLNRAIFETLMWHGSQTVYDMHRQVTTRRKLRNLRYASVNKRVKALENSRFIKRAVVKKTKAGFEAAMYELSGRGYSFTNQLNKLGHPCGNS